MTVAIPGGTSVPVQWILDYSDLMGNDAADFFTKKAQHDGQHEYVPLS